MCLGLVALFSIPEQLPAADPGKAERKAKELAAKQFVKQAAQAEQAGHTAEARRLYLQAEAQIFTKDAEKGLEHLDSQDRGRVHSLLAAAERSWTKNDIAAVDQTLSEAERLQSGNATILYDFALTLRREGKFPDSELFLVRAIVATPNEEIRLRLVSLLSSWREGQPADTSLKATTFSKEAASQIANVNRSLLISQGRWLSSADRDEKVVRDPCSAIAALGPPAANESAPLRMDRGLCAAVDGDFARSADLLESTSLHDREAEAAKADFAGLARQLAALPMPQGDDVRRLYAQAFSQLATQKFVAALATYEQAAAALPSFAESTHQVALLADALGETQRATLAWKALLESDAFRQDAQAALRSEPQLERQYATAIAAARQPLEALLHRHMIDGDLAHKHYALEQMEKCALHLQEAAAVRPLAPDVQTIGALLAMQRNDFARAEWHGRTLASARANLSFYAAIYTHAPGDASKKKGLPIQFSRIDIVRDKIGIMQLSLYNSRKHRSVPSPGSGQLLWDTALHPNAADVSTIRKLETRDEYMYLELTGERKKIRKLWIEPLHLALEVPPQGPAARRFANQYTHMVASIVGYDTAKLGKESLTFGERMRLAYDFASIGLEAYSAVLNPMGVYGVYSEIRHVTQTISQDGRLVGRNGSGDNVTFALPFQFVPSAVPERFVTELK